MESFNCPKCNEPMEAPTSLIGTWLECPACKISVLVPGKVKLTATEVSARQVTGTKVSASDDGGALQICTVTIFVISLLASGCLVLYGFVKLITWPEYIGGWYIAAGISVALQGFAFLIASEIHRQLRLIVKRLSRAPNNPPTP